MKTTPQAASLLPKIKSNLIKKKRKKNTPIHINKFPPTYPFNLQSFPTPLLAFHALTL